MSCDTLAERIDELADGTLPEAEARALHTHLTACPPCRRLHEAQRALALQARALPRERTPDRDLWPAVAAAIAAPPLRAAGAPALPRRGWIAFLRAAVVPAAAVLLLGVVSMGYRFTSRPSGQAVSLPLAREGTPPDQPSNAAAGRAEPVTAMQPEEQRYHQAVASLRRALATRRPGLSPATLEIVERNLTAIDEALREIEQALRADPGNLLLGQLWQSTNRQKVALLERMLALVGPG